MIELTPAVGNMPGYKPAGTKYRTHPLVTNAATPSDRAESGAAIVELLLAMPKPSLQRKVLKTLSVSQLIGILTGLVVRPHEDEPRRKAAKKEGSQSPGAHKQSFAKTNDPSAPANAIAVISGPVDGVQVAHIKEDTSEDVYNGKMTGTTLEHANAAPTVPQEQGLERGEQESSSSSSSSKFRDVDNLEKSHQRLFGAIKDTLNSFPCLKLVDEMVPAGPTDPYIASMENKHVYGVDADDNTDHFDDDDDELWDSDSCKYQLAIQSKSFEQLMSLLLENEDLGIQFPLVDIKTRHLNAASNFLKYFARGIKISNERLTMLGSSDTVMQKLRVVTLSNYENLDSIQQCHTIEKIIVYGNEVDFGTVQKLIDGNPDLKRVYYKGRVYQEGMVFPRSPSCNDAFDLIFLENLHYQVFEMLGEDRFVGLSIHVTEPTPIELDFFLNRLTSLRRLEVNVLYGDDRYKAGVHAHGYSNPNLQRLTLSHFALDEESSFAGLSKLGSLRLVDCEINAASLDTLHQNIFLKKLSILNTKVHWNALFNISPNLEYLTMQNSQIEESKDLLFASFAMNSLQPPIGVETKRMICMDLNSEKQELKLRGCEQLAIVKLNGDPATKIHFPKGMTKLSIANYPNFNSTDWSNVSLKPFNILTEIQFTIYSYGNIWHKPLNLPLKNSIKYDITYVNVNRLGKGAASNDSSAVPEGSDEDLYEMAYSSDYEEEYERAVRGKRGRKAGRGRRSSRGLTGRGRGRGNRTVRASRPRKKREEKNKPVPDDQVPVQDGKYLDVHPEDMTQFQKGYKGRQLPFPVAKHTAPPLASPEDPTKPYQCRFCKRSFDRRENFRRHSLIHTDYRPYVCPKCKKGFKRSDNLRSHMRVCHAAEGGDALLPESLRARGRRKRNEKALAENTGLNTPLGTSAIPSSSNTSPPVTPAQGAEASTASEIVQQQTGTPPSTGTQALAPASVSGAPQLPSVVVAAAPQSRVPAKNKSKKPARPAVTRFVPMKGSAPLEASNKPMPMSLPIAFIPSSRPSAPPQKLRMKRQYNNTFRQFDPQNGSGFVPAPQDIRTAHPIAVAAPGGGMKIELGLPKPVISKPNGPGPAVSKPAISRPRTKLPPINDSPIARLPPMAAPEESTQDKRTFEFVSGISKQHRGKQLNPMTQKQTKRLQGEEEPWKLGVLGGAPNAGTPAAATTTTDDAVPDTTSGPERNASPTPSTQTIAQAASTASVASTTPEIEQTHLPIPESQPSSDGENVLIFRMERPQQFAPNDEPVMDPQGSDMEQRRLVIRQKVNEAFNRCNMTKNGHYICYRCGKNFAKRGNVKRHLILHLDVDLYDCICGRTFQRSDNYKTHFAKCKRRKELGLPVTFDADDMQVIPRRKSDRNGADDSRESSVSFDGDVGAPPTKGNDILPSSVPASVPTTATSTVVAPETSAPTSAPSAAVSPAENDDNGNGNGNTANPQSGFMGMLSFHPKKDEPEAMKQSQHTIKLQTSPQLPSAQPGQLMQALSSAPAFRAAPLHAEPPKPTIPSMHIRGMGKPQPQGAMDAMLTTHHDLGPRTQGASKTQYQNPPAAAITPNPAHQQMVFESNPAPSASASKPTPKPASESKLPATATKYVP